MIARRADEVFVSTFLVNAEEILEVARTAQKAGASPCEWAMVVTPDGGIRMLDAAGWRLSSLEAEFGAETVYHVSRRSEGVRLEARARGRYCLLQSQTPAARARQLLNPEGWYVHSAMVAYGA